MKVALSERQPRKSGVDTPQNRAVDATYDHARGKTSSTRQNNGLAIAPLLRGGLYPTDYQVACCRSLGDIGFANLPIRQIDQYLRSSRRWTQSLRLFLDHPFTAVVFPAGIPAMQNLHRLATLHDKPVRPPRRFVCSGYPAHARRRTPSVYRNAYQTHQTIMEALSRHSDWIDIARLPIDENTIKLLRGAADTRFGGWLPHRRQAIQSLLQWVENRAELHRRKRSGDLEQLVAAVESAVRFAGHEHYSRRLGPAFAGVDTAWQSLYGCIGFSQSLNDIVMNQTVAAELVARWPALAEPFYALSRQASTVSRRCHKLTHLVRRLYTPPQRPDELLALAIRTTERLELWLRVVRTIPGHSELTPRQLLSSLRVDTVPTLTRTA